MNTLPELPRDIQNTIARELSVADWRSMQLSCKALRNAYQHPDLWRWRAQNMPVLPEFVFDHPEFQRYNFDFRQLVQILVQGGDGLAEILKPSVEPWQLAALLGMHEKLVEIYGDQIVELADEHQYHVVDYYLLGRHENLFVAFVKQYQGKFTAADDPDHRFPIFAAKTGNISMMKRLVKEYQYNIRSFDATTQRNLLHYAVASGHRGMTQWLVEQGVPINQGESLAIPAVQGAYWKIYEDLLACGIKIDKSIAIGIARFAAQRGNKIIFDSILKDFDISLERFNKVNQLTFFHHVVSGGDFDMVNSFLVSGLGSLKKMSKDGKLIIHHAAEFGHVTLIMKLIEKNPKKLFADSVDKNGNNLLHYSAKFGCWRRTILLCDLLHLPRIDLLKPNKLGETICHLAADNKRLNFLHLVRKNFGSEPLTALDRKNNSVLHHACYHGASTLSLWLIHTVELSLLAKNKDGDTPLHVLAKQALKNEKLWCDFETIARTVDHTVITDIKNTKKQSPYDLMIQGKRHELAAALAENAATVNTPKSAFK